MSAVTIAAIERGLRRAPPMPPGRVHVRWRAAVAVALRDPGSGTEVLMIRRAERPGDRWSGDAALPGGRVSPDDLTIEATAVREAREEVGIELDGATSRCLGRLSDHPRGRFRRWMSLAVTPVLFEVQGDPPLVPDPREVASVRWVPLAALRDPAHQGRLIHWWRPVWKLPLGLPMLLPKWRYEDLTIWGLTHAILQDVLTVAALGRP